MGFCRAAVAGRDLAAVVWQVGDTALAPPLRWAHVRLKCLRDDTLPSSRDTAAAQGAARPSSGPPFRGDERRAQSRALGHGAVRRARLPAWTFPRRDMRRAGM